VPEFFLEENVVEHDRLGATIGRTSGKGNQQIEKM